jgi:HD-GYP domain-containing protein (c-di-GMP phosphodiesterase class II)
MGDTASNIVCSYLGDRLPVVIALLAALSARHAETADHCWRVARYALRLADAYAAQVSISTFCWNEEMRAAMAVGSLLHDVGKLGVADAVLSKAGKLDAAERQAIEEHVLIGMQIIHYIPGLQAALPIVSYHHERWDGNGYPHRLSAERIPALARLFAIVDTYDAIISRRCYREAADYAIAAEQLTQGAGQQYDPIMVDTFLRLPESEWAALR